jgi:hypothetical protein
VLEFAESKAAVYLQAMVCMYLARARKAVLKRKIAAARLVKQAWRSHWYVVLPLTTAHAAFFVHEQDATDDNKDDELLGLPLLEFAESKAAIYLQAMVRMNLAHVQVAELKQNEVVEDKRDEMVDEDIVVDEDVVEDKFVEDELNEVADDKDVVKEEDAVEVEVAEEAPPLRHRQPARKCKSHPAVQPTCVQPPCACKRKV